MAIDFDEWMKYGYDQGWISDVFCDTHDGAPWDDDEMNQWESGGDPCAFCVRVFHLN